LPPPDFAGDRAGTVPFSRTTKIGAPVAQVRDVLVPLDGSRAAEHALPWALRIASQTGAQLRLAYVHRPMDEPLHRRRTQMDAAFEDVLRKPMQQYLSRLMRRMARASTETVTPVWLDGREVGEALAAMAEKSDLVVMATRCRSFVSRLLLGSVTSQVSHRLATPMLLVPGYRAPVDLTGRPALRRALVPLDGSKGSEEILAALAQVSSDLSSEQVLLRVTNDDTLCDAWDTPRYCKWSEFKNGPLAQVQEVASRWKAVFPSARPSVLWTDASAAKSIAQQAKELDIDFIALATRPRSLLRRLIKPGVFGHLLRQGEWPLLVVQQRQSIHAHGNDLWPSLTPRDMATRRSA